MKIDMFAGGKWHSEDEIQVIADGLKSDGYSAARIKTYLEGLDTKPNKAGKFMTMWFENGEYRTVVRGGALRCEIACKLFTYYLCWRGFTNVEIYRKTA